MSRSTFTSMILIAIGVVYLEARWTVVESGWRGQIDLLPVFAAYAALHGRVGVMAGVAAIGGCWFDVLSANPLGTSLLSLFLTAYLLHGMHEVLLKGQMAAQFFVCVLAGALNPTIAGLILWVLGTQPILGWGTLWQVLINAVCCGLAGPVLFLILNQLDQSLSYAPTAKPWNRPVVEVKRSKHYHHY